MPILYKIEDRDNDLILKDKLRKIIDHIQGRLDESEQTIQVVTHISPGLGGGGVTLIPHNLTHERYGSDPIKLDNLDVSDDNTDLNVSATKHGLCPKLNGDATDALLGDGTYGNPDPAIHATTHESGGDDEINHDDLLGFLENEHLPGIDEDDMASDSDVHVPTQQSVKAYVDTHASPTYCFIKATGQSGLTDLHLSDGTNWNTNKALIKVIRVVTNSTDWDLWLMFNDNGYAIDDANIPKLQLMDFGDGDTMIYLNMPYYDEDDSGEVHVYFIDNSGANTFDIYIQGYKLR